MVAEYFSDNRTELFEFAEALIDYDTQNAAGRSVRSESATEAEMATNRSSPEGR
ncbi:hypothetical protein ACFR97_03165 [Haloplanus litoreus]|uniref:Uncharacterized protein n=1 Tax=Haloplanus litoreus TaxID=767515 RepID=A0ABD5ZZG0_9EURY